MGGLFLVAGVVVLVLRRRAAAAEEAGAVPRQRSVGAPVEGAPVVTLRSAAALKAEEGYSSSPRAATLRSKA